MAKYLKLFETSAEYQQFIEGDEFLLPNVSLVKDTKSLSFYPLAQEEPELPYLTMTALEDDLTVSFSNPCQYSLNGTDWNDLSANATTPAISSGEKIYFKKILKSGLDESVGQFTVSKKFNLSGNCMSMLFGDEAQGKTDLTGFDGCFEQMFNYCARLVSVSKNFLPATTLAENCYVGMFGDCYSLVTAPELPATTLASRCYDNMFYNCTSLVTAPELPATTLADYCYYEMFSYCTSLVNAPELPATTLADECYQSMFAGCTSLVTAPELPATTLTDGCYQSMFEGCESLNYIKMLATDIDADFCLDYWVDNVSSTGTFVKSKDATWDESEAIPEGWTVERV